MLVSVDRQIIASAAEDLPQTARKARKGPIMLLSAK